MMYISIFNVLSSYPTLSGKIHIYIQSHSPPCLFHAHILCSQGQSCHEVRWNIGKRARTGRQGPLQVPFQVLVFLLFPNAFSFSSPPTHTCHLSTPSLPPFLLSPPPRTLWNAMGRVRERAPASCSDRWDYGLAFQPMCAVSSRFWTCACRARWQNKKIHVNCFICCVTQTNLSVFLSTTPSNWPNNSGDDRGTSAAISLLNVPEVNYLTQQSKLQLFIFRSSPW